MKHGLIFSVLMHSGVALSVLSWTAPIRDLSQPSAFHVEIANPSVSGHREIPVTPAQKPPRQSHKKKHKVPEMGDKKHGDFPLSPQGGVNQAMGSAQEVKDVQRAYIPPRVQGAYTPLPHYPAMARKRGHEGRVEAKVHLLPSGKIDAVVISSSSGHEELDDSVIDALQSWTFRGAALGNTPLASLVTLSFEFTLKE